MNLEIFEPKPEELHEFWPFIRRGLEVIKKRIQPNWIPEDVYSMLRANMATCTIAARTPGYGESGLPWQPRRLLGFGIYSKQFRPFSFEPEGFIWAAWNLPMNEWLPEDDMPATVAATRRHVGIQIQTAYGTNKITWATRYSRAKAFLAKFGWRPAYVTFQVTVDEYINPTPTDVTKLKRMFKLFGADSE